MIAIDASALLAVLLEEPEGPALRRALTIAGGGVISAVNFWEVLARAYSAKGDVGRRAAEALVAGAGILVSASSVHEARQAADAFERFGKGTGSGARLNLGDCFAYALAQREGDGLLYKGNDFARTDVKSVLP